MSRVKTVLTKARPFLRRQLDAHLKELSQMANRVFIGIGWGMGLTLGMLTVFTVFDLLKLVRTLVL